MSNHAPDQVTERSAGRCPFSVKEVEGTDPFAHYEKMRAYGEVIWDEACHAT